MWKCVGLYACMCKHRYIYVGLRPCVGVWVWICVRGLREGCRCEHVNVGECLYVSLWVYVGVGGKCMCL